MDIREVFLGSAARDTRKPITRYLMLFILLCGSIFLLGASSGNRQSAELRVILANPLANMRLTTAQEVERSYKDTNKSFILPKPAYAEVRVKYEPNSPFTKEDVYKEIVRLIEEHGWKREYQSPDGDHYRASLPSISDPLIAQVYIRTDTPTVLLSIMNRGI